VKEGSPVSANYLWWELGTDNLIQYVNEYRRGK